MPVLDETIRQLYHKALPAATRKGISLNLDLRAGASEISLATAHQIQKFFNLSLKRTGVTRLMIRTSTRQLELSDNGAPLTKTECNALINDGRSVKSRVGFGTTVTIVFNPPK